MRIFSLVKTYAQLPSTFDDRLQRRVVVCRRRGTFRLWRQRAQRAEHILEGALVFRHLRVVRVAERARVRFVARRRRLARTCDLLISRSINN